MSTDRESTIDQTMDNTKVQFHETMDFVGLLKSVFIGE